MEQNMIGNLYHWTSDNISGWAADEAHPEKIVYIELRVNGVMACRIPARLYRSDLEQAGLGHGRHGFSFDPRLYLMDGLNYLELIISGSNVILASRNIVDMEGGNLLEISQMRWKGDELPEGLTWGRRMSGDSFVDVLEAHCRLDKDTRVVEAGPGYGRILSTLLEREIPFRNYYGIEISAPRVTRLMEQFTDERVQFEMGDINTHRFRELADVVISSATFVHLYPDCSKALKNIRGQISDNALIAIDFVDPMHYPPSKGFDDTTGTYVICYSCEELNQIFYESGYVVVSMPQYVIGIGETGGEIGEVFGLMVIARPRE
jgi:hypothetical protein